MGVLEKDKAMDGRRRTHDQETDSDGLRYPDELLLVGLWSMG
jgi:hypothetical protein